MHNVIFIIIIIILFIIILLPYIHLSKMLAI